MIIENRWSALSVIFVSFLQFTLNWFNIVPTFGHLSTEMGLSPTQIGGVIGMFIAGYGIAHIPGGLLAEAFGMRFAMLAGIGIETLGTLTTSSAQGYEMLLLARFVCGVGGSIYIGSAIGLTMAWFREHELATANGIITGVAFTVGAGLGLYVWTLLVAATGWRDALLFGALAGAVTFAFLLFVSPFRPSGHHADIGGRHLDTQSLRRTFGNRSLWLLGFAFFGGYGSYFTAAELLPAYAQVQMHLSPQDANALGIVLLMSGAVGGALGGWLADKVFGVIPTIVGAWLFEALALVLVPHVGEVGLFIVAAVIGGAAILGFVAWIAMPGMYREEITLSDIPTACGLMLTIAAIGGVTMPPTYGAVSSVRGYAAAWIALGCISALTALLCLVVGHPAAARLDRVPPRAVIK